MEIKNFVPGLWLGLGGGGGGGVNVLILSNRFKCVQFGLIPVHYHSVKIVTNHVTLCKILHKLVLLEVRERNLGIDFRFIFIIQTDC